MTIGEKIKIARKQKKISQQELGNTLGVSQAMIAQYEKGDRNPKLGTITKIAAALEVNIFELIDKEDFIAQKNKLNEFLTPEKQKESEDLEDWMELYSQGKTEINSWDRELELLSHFRKLNFSGEHEAIKRVSELTEIPRYTKSDGLQKE